MVPFVSRVAALVSHGASFELTKTRETSNKALHAINQMSLVPFLMSFLAVSDKLPLSTVTAAGEYHTGLPVQTFLILTRSPWK